MEDSDDEIFWGPVTVRELKIISQQLVPTCERNTKRVGTESDLDSSQEEDRPINDLPNNGSGCKILNDEGSAEKNEMNILQGFERSTLHVHNYSSPNDQSTVPEIVITCSSSPEQGSPVTNSESDVMTENENCSLIRNSLVDGKETSQISNEPLQSGNDYELLECDMSNSEAFACKYDDKNEDNVSNPEETCETSNDDSIKQLSNMSNEIIIEYESLNFNVSTGGTCNSTKSNLSSLQKTCETFENYSDSCKSVFASSASSVEINFSGSVESAILSNDCDLTHSKLTTLSLNSTESQPEKTNNCHFVNGIPSEIEKSEHDVTVVSHADCEAVSGLCVSDFVAETESQIVAERCDSNMFHHTLQKQSETSLKDNYLELTYKSTDKDQSLNIEKRTTGKQKRTPLRNIACTSKIPVLLNSPSSGPSKEKGHNVKSNASECHGNRCTEWCASGLPFSIPLSPVTYTVSSDNLVTVAPGGNIIPRNYCGPSIHSSTNSLSANYVHVMQSDQISELSRQDFYKVSSPCAKEEVSTSSVKRQSTDSDSSEAYNIEAESDSILCSSSSLLGDSSTGNENSLNGTLEEIEMMLKQGFEYMCNKNDLNLPESQVQSNTLPDSVPKSEPKQNEIPRGLKHCQYIRTSQEELNPSAFHKDFKEKICVATAKTPVVRAYPLKPTSASCPRPLQRLKKASNFSNIRSPVGAYIKDRPVQLFKTAGKVKPFGKDDISPRFFEKETVGLSVKQTLVDSVPMLPEITYEKAPGINVNPARTTERSGPSKKPYATPTVIRHAGRAVLATVPQNAVQILKNAEVSVLYDKDVSKTATL